MVSSSNEDLDLAISYVSEQLKAFGFSLYPPVPGSDKAARGRCSDSFNFLGCTIQPNRCVPSARSLDKIKTDLTSTLSKSKAAIVEAIRTGKTMDPRLSHSAVLQSVGKKIFGWQKSFSFCTDSNPFRQLDDYITSQINMYEAFIFRRKTGIDPQLKMAISGIPSTELLHKSDRARG
jgi:hypothetical protein